uniref:Uncharacterized protein n=1 Tax=Chenopodium quinoa TaxID=63459 RepID=A0A803KUF2_CHEQI
MLSRPPVVRTPEEKRDKRLWCEYHRECGHTTKNCKELKKALDQLADEGKLNKYLKGSDRLNRNAREARSDDTGGHVAVIAGGLALGGSCLKYNEEDLAPVDKPFIGFGGQSVFPKRTNRLPVRLGPKGKGRSVVTHFLVVDTPLPYNVIPGRPLLNEVKMTISVYQLLMQFKLEDGTFGMVYGDQRSARECYVNSLKRASEALSEPLKKSKITDPSVLFTE